MELRRSIDRIAPQMRFPAAMPWLQQLYSAASSRRHWQDRLQGIPAGSLEDELLTNRGHPLSVTDMASEYSGPTYEPATEDAVGGA